MTSSPIFSSFIVNQLKLIQFYLKAEFFKSIAFVPKSRSLTVGAIQTMGQVSTM